MLPIFLAFGIAYGIVLQRSGFCFAKAGFEISLLRSREAFNGVMVGLVVATLGFSIVTAVRMHLGLDPTSHVLVIPIGLSTVVGAVLFGTGMALAGMCAAGTLLRLGEGYLVAWITLTGIVLGAALDPFRAFVPDAWKIQHGGVWLGNHLGPMVAPALAVLALVATWLLARPRPKRRVAGASTPRPLRTLLAPTVIGGIALGLIDTVQMAVATPWTVGYPLSLVAAATSGSVTRSAFQQALPLLVLNGGLVLGSLISAAHGKSFGLRAPRHWREVAIALAGGILMGWGIQLGRGCSIGGVFSAIPSLSLSGWLFLPSLFFGAWVGSHIIRRLG